ncbi:MAG: amidohydrolase [Chloroflexi bacterium]|nr:amidohydrolase [Chloroflexota bacterium]
MIVDVHTHFVPKVYLDAVEREPDVWGARLRRDEAGRPWIVPTVYPLPLGVGPIDETWCVAEQKMAALDGQGVDVGTIAPPTFMFFYWADEPLAMKVTRLQNDGLAEAARTFPDRFAGMATVPLQNVPAAIQELERAIGTLGLRGVEIGTNVNGRDLDDPALFPFFQAAAEMQTPIFVHPNACAVAGGRAGRYYFENSVGFLLDTTLAIGSLIYGGVMDRLPDLRIYFAHGGGFVPYQIGRFDHVAQVRQEAKGLIPRLPTDYLKQLRFDALTHSLAALEYLVSLVGPTQVMVGTDHPFDMGEPHPGRDVRALASASSADKERILSGNAAEWFGIVPRIERAGANGKRS